MTRQRILIVFGLPGSGKSYFSRYLALDTGYDHINTDMIRQSMNMRGQYDDGSKQLVYDKLEAAMAEKLSENLNVIVDGTFHRKGRRRQFLGKAREMHADICFIEMKASPASVKERLQSARDDSEADFHVYQQIRNNFEPMNDPHLILWSDRLSMEDMLATTKQYLNGQKTDT
jgi:predicted kinase